MFKKVHVFTLILVLVFVIGFGTLITSPVLANEGKTTKVTAKGDGIWILPGKRALDPEVFGTPQNPKKVEQLPLEAREVSEDGESFTMTKNPGPFSNKVKEITGSLNIQVNDKTILDTPESKDTATFNAKFTGPSGNNTYKIELKKLIPVGPHHQFFGGVGTNLYMHGTTGIGEPLMPNIWSYVTFWGVGDFYKNEEKVDSKRIIHVMVTPRLRDENYKLGFGIAQKDELEIHVIMPPEKVSEGHPVDSPLPTGFELPNGKEQPFLHINFYENIEVMGNAFLK